VGQSLQRDDAFARTVGIETNKEPTMKGKPIFLPLILLSLAAAQPKAAAPAPAPAAVPPPTTAGCLLVSNLVAKHATEAKDRDLAQSAFYFFIGRLGDRTTPDQLKSAFQAQERLIKAATVSPLMNACLRQMQQKLQMIQSVGQQLQQAK
jgi:hypothetical protein